jgi:hypothetical protein
VTGVLVFYGYNTFKHPDSRASLQMHEIYEILGNHLMDATDALLEKREKLRELKSHRRRRKPKIQHLDNRINLDTNCLFIPPQYLPSLSEEAMKDAMTGMPRRDINSLSKSDVKTLAILNDYLSETEIWIRSRAKRGLSTYYKICESGAFIDVSLDAKVYCFRSKNSPNFDSAFDNLITVIEAGFLLSPSVSGNSHTTWTERHASSPNPLSGLSICRLFGALCCQSPSGDFASLLEIGSVRMEIVMRQERELAWS